MDTAHRGTLIIFTRYPTPGTVKTRLIPALGPDRATGLHRDMTRHVMDVARQGLRGQPVDIEIHFTGGDADGMQALYGDDMAYVPQQGRDLGERMRSAITGSLESGAHAAVLVGTDCPGVTGAILRQAFFALEEADCVLGPASDGGYYLVAIKRDVPEIFSFMPWGTPAVREMTLGALGRLGMKTVLLDELSDVDTPADLPVWKDMEQAMAEPAVSVIIPALNEEAGVSRAVGRALSGRNVEVVVADGGSSDSTVRRARSAGALVLSTGGGRACQMNTGAEASSGDILLFLHADTLLPERYDGMVRKALAGEGTVAGAFSLAFEDTCPALEIIAMGANMRARILGLPYGDQAIFVKRDAFHRAGGFRVVPIMEDVIFMKAVRGIGGVTILSDRVITSGRRFRALGTFKTWVMNQLAMGWYALGMPLDDLAELYRGREASLRAWAGRMKSAWRDRKAS